MLSSDCIQVGPENTSFSVDYILRHMGFLKEIIDQDFGLRGKLFARQILTKGERDRVQNKESLEERNLQLLELMTNKSDEDRQSFLSCLEQSSQKHVVNYIHGTTNDQCGDDLPLDEQRRHMLTTYYDKLAELLDSEELVNILYSKKCLSRNHKDCIQKKQTNFDKNEQLLDILFLRSIADFNTFVRCLGETGQKHIAECLKNGGAIIDVAEVGSIGDAEFVEQMKRQLHSASPDRLRQVEELIAELRERGVNLMDVQHGSVRLYFWCLNESSVLVLKDWVETGRLQTVIEKMFALVSSKRSPAPVRLSYDREQFDRALRFFREREKFIDSALSTNAAEDNVMWTLRYKLATIIDPDYGLIDELFELAVLDKDQCESIRSRTTVDERVIQLLEYITNKTDYYCQQFLVALQRNLQNHAVNFIRAKGVRDEQYGDDWPLGDLEKTKLECNQQFLMVYCGGIIWNLSPDILNQQQLGRFQTHQFGPRSTSDHRRLLSDKLPKSNCEMFNFLPRRSIFDWKTFIDKLKVRDKHAAEVLQSNGVVVTVGGRLRHPMIDCIKFADKLQQTVRSTRPIIELAQFHEIGIELIDVNLHRNILLFHCRDNSSLRQLVRLINEEVFQNCFNKFLARILILPATFSLELDLQESEIKRCETFLSKITELAAGRNSLKSLELSDTIDVYSSMECEFEKMPIELTQDMLLSIASIMFSQKKLLTERAAESIHTTLTTLCKVCHRWWDLLQDSRNRRKLISGFKRCFHPYRLSFRHMADFVVTCAPTDLYMRPILAIAASHDKLFVLTKPTEIEVYQVMPPFNRLRTFKRNLKASIKAYTGHDMAACAESGYLFISGGPMPNDYNVPYVGRVDMGKTQWKETQISLSHINRGMRTATLSVYSRRLLVTSWSGDFFVCDVDGALIQRMTLPPHINMKRAVESRRGTFIVSYKTDMLPKNLMIGEFDTNGSLINCYMDDESQFGGENGINNGLALGPGNSVLVAWYRQGSRRPIVVLDGNLKRVRVETFAEDPHWLFYDDKTGLLFVETRDSNRRDVMRKLFPSQDQIIQFPYFPTVIEVYDVLSSDVSHDVSRTMYWPSGRQRTLFNGCIYTDGLPSTKNVRTEGDRSNAKRRRPRIRRRTRRQVNVDDHKLGEGNS